MIFKNLWFLAAVLLAAGMVIFMYPKQSSFHSFNSSLLQEFLRSALQNSNNSSPSNQSSQIQGFSPQPAEENITKIEGQKKKYSNLAMVEANLAQARAAIRAAKAGNETDVADPDYVPNGPMYWDPKAFHRSYLEMEKKLKVYIYEEGDPPVFHFGPCKHTYAIEGIFIANLELSHFRTYDPREANLFFLPFSITMITQVIYIPESHEWGLMKNTALDYVNVIANKYPYWNRSLGADHFMLACHDWGPEISFAVPHLHNNSIRALCNANTSERFDASRDVSIPEIHLPTGTTKGLLGGPRPSQRSILVFYAGGVHGPIRPILLEHWENSTDPDVQIYKYLPKKMSYYGMMRKSRYCICPSGYEVASPRMVEGIYMGCVPVLIKDNYVIPFSDVLDWEKFAVIVPAREIPNLKKILAGIKLRDYVRLQRAGIQMRRHFEVNSPPRRMESKQAAREERAEVAARTAADELSQARRERETEGVVVQKPEGVIGSLIRTVQGTVGHAKDAVMGKSNEAAEKTRETAEDVSDRAAAAKDTAAHKAAEYKDYTAEKTKEAADSAAQKAAETKDATATKMGEYRDYTAEKTKETAESAAEKAKQAKDATVGKLGEYKDYAAEKAKGAKDATVDKTVEYEDYTAEKAKNAKDATVETAKNVKDATAEKAKNAKDATVDKAVEYKDYTAEKAKNAKDATMEKATEYKDYAADKAGQAKDATVETAKNAKDATVEKAGQAKDVTKEKAKEGKDATVGTITGLKDSAAGAARRAVDYITGKKEETKQEAIETGEAVKQKAGETTEAAKEKYDEAKEEARRKMEDMRIEGERQGDAASVRQATSAERGGGGGGGVFGVLGAIKDKLTPHPTDTTAEKGSSISYGGEGEAKGGRILTVDEEGVPVVVRVDVETTTAGAIAELLKEADQLSGQTFNDVGPLDDEGTARVRVERMEKK